MLNATEEMSSMVSDSKEFVVLNTSGRFSKLSSLLSVVQIKHTNFLIFSAGPSMELPKLNYKVAGVGSSSKPLLKDFILKKAF